MSKIIELKYRKTGEIRILPLVEFINEINFDLACDEYKYNEDDWRDGYSGTVEEEAEILALYEVQSLDIPCGDVIKGEIYENKN